MTDTPDPTQDDAAGCDRCIGGRIRIPDIGRDTWSPCPECSRHDGAAVTPRQQVARDLLLESDASVIPIRDCWCCPWHNHGDASWPASCGHYAGPTTLSKTQRRPPHACPLRRGPTLVELVEDDGRELRPERK